jgi:hypothetical protein
VVEDDWKQLSNFMPKLRQSKSFANNIILSPMADIVLDCLLRKGDLGNANRYQQLCLFRDGVVGA